ncbi:TlpA disulfide reductase family protein [Hymenobacter edaphi]|uniref:TlpA family protein disulfide reductase n=1 Tax=Hymenobacter edaphi TaxID=2211146 RepID=A0A328BH79_9BACT|nr:TlpA disulfide reductase family protein [Hymenobacter edaphi]RAK65891.1 TlpA family protein disulfide reductase [Hymenobacter edaphi]
MNKFLRLPALLLLLAAAPAARAQQVRVVKLPALQQLLQRPTDTTYVVNFWATWCKPCIEELPHFEQLRAKYARQKVQVLLVSLDFPSKLDAKVRPFVQKQGLKSRVWLLNETDQNAYIDAIDRQWSGALPFTLVLNNARQRRQRFEQPLTLAALEKAVLAVQAP